MTPLLVSLIVLCMAGVIGTAIYHALYGSHRALEERFADLAIKVRAQTRPRVKSWPVRLSRPVI